MFEWDAKKAATNVARHGVSFGEAATVFGDAEALDGPDLLHSGEEPRFLRLGRSVQGRILMVAYMLRKTRNGEKVRIISARRANRKERAAYADPPKD